MVQIERVWKLQRGSGILAALLLTMALLMLFDGLRTGIFGVSDVRLVPGEDYAISGPMPPKTEHLADFVIKGNAADGSVVLVPESTYTGYWLGGGMWRGRILVGPEPQPGEYRIAIGDKFGEKQNPALVFVIKIFSSPEQRRAHSPSIVYRVSGLNPYLLAVCAATAGLAAAGCNFLFGQKWSALLNESGCGEIFRLKAVNGRLEAGVEMVHAKQIKIGTNFRFTHPRRGDLGQGEVVACGRGEITVAAPGHLPVRLGDIACPVHG